MLFFHHDQLRASFLPPGPHDTHTFWLTAPFDQLCFTPKCLINFFTAVGKLFFVFLFFFLKQRGWYLTLSALVCYFCPLKEECQEMHLDDEWQLLEYQISHSGRGARDVLDNRMWGGNLTALSHACRIALQPHCFLHHSIVCVSVCVCIYVCVCFGWHPEH